jgi:hypothetical protein
MDGAGADAPTMDVAGAAPKVNVAGWALNIDGAGAAGG